MSLEDLEFDCISNHPMASSIKVARAQIALLLCLPGAFFLEGLHGTRYLPVIAMLAVICGSFLLVFSKDLPPQMQRALSFLPVNVSPSVKADAQGSLDWRMEVWRVVVADVPHYLFRGKGYAMTHDGIYMSQINSNTRNGLASEWAIEYFDSVWNLGRGGFLVVSGGHGADVTS